MVLLVICVADLGAVTAVFRKVNPVLVGVATLLAFVDRLILTSRWQILLAARSLHISFGRLFRVQLAANFFGSFLPSSIGVDGLRIAALCRAGIAPAEVIATTMVDRATIVLASLIFGAAMVFALAGTRISGDLKYLVFSTTLAALVSCSLLFNSRIREWVRLRATPLLSVRIGALVQGVGRAVLAYRHEVRRMTIVSVITLLVLGLRIAFAYVLAKACGADVAVTDLLLVIPIVWVIVMIPITVGGIGLQEISYVTLLSLIGVSAEIAVSISLIEHVIVRAVTLPGALFIREVTGYPEDGNAAMRGDRSARQSNL
jgi:glycosyltransferase 2 family protein